MAYLDEKLKKTNNFVNVINSVVATMFNVETDCKRIYIDLNSCLSIIFRYGNVNDTDMLAGVLAKIEEFMQKYLVSGVELVFLFTLHPSRAHTDIFVDWCKNRNERVNLAKCTVIKAMVLGINEESKKNKLIKILNTKHVHPVLSIYEMEKNNKRKFMILSKDFVFQNLPFKHAVIFTGINYIDMTDNEKVMADDVQLSHPDYMLPVYLALAGDGRNDFKGKLNYAKHRAKQFCEKYKLEIKENIDPPEDDKNKEWYDCKEHIEKYTQLYDINKLLLINKEEIPILK